MLNNLPTPFRLFRLALKGPTSASVLPDTRSSTMATCMQHAHAMSTSDSTGNSARTNGVLRYIDYIDYINYIEYSHEEVGLVGIGMIGGTRK